LQIGDNTGNSVVQNVTIKNIEFANFNRAIMVVPQFGQPTTVLCADLTIGTGVASTINIQNNKFTNNRRGVHTIGNATHLSLQDNLSSNNLALSFYYQGGASTCTPTVVGGLTWKLVGLIKDSAILGNNDNDTQGATAIAATGTDSLKIANNVLTSTGNSFAIIEPSNNSKLKIANNLVKGSGFMGVYLSDATQETIPYTGAVYTVPSSQVSVNNNVISDNALAGVLIASDTPDTSVINNTLSGNGLADVYLCGGMDPGMADICFPATDPVVVFTPSHDNKIVTTNFFCRRFKLCR
jgi:parallel beta-helix repeat protein